jgi:hypothetical protein
MDEYTHHHRMAEQALRRRAEDHSERCVQVGDEWCCASECKQTYRLPPAIARMNFAPEPLRIPPYEDSLRPARGMLYGVLISVGLYVAAIVTLIITMGTGWM